MNLCLHVNSSILKTTYTNTTQLKTGIGNDATTENARNREVNEDEGSMTIGL